MASYTAPGVYFEEVQSYPSAIAPTTKSVPIFYGLAEWGPAHLPTKIANFGEYQSTFGGYLTYDDLTYCVDNYYKEAGAVNSAVGGDCYIVRLTKQNATYTGVDTAVIKASVDLISAETAGTSAETAAITVTGKYYGLLGNKLSVKTVLDPIRPSKLTDTELTLDLTADGITAGADSFEVPSLVSFKAGQVLKIANGATVEYVLVTSTETIDNGDGTYTYRLYITSDSSLDGTFANSFVQSGTSVESCEFTLYEYLNNTLVKTWKQLSVNAEASNYFKTVINDETAGSKYIAVAEATGVASTYSALIPEELSAAVRLSGATLEVDADYTITDLDFQGDITALTGMYSINKLKGKAAQVAYPGASASRLKMLQSYLESRRDLHLAAGVPTSDTNFASISTKAAAISWRDRNGFDSKYLSLYYPRIKVSDPIGFGRVPLREIDPCGSILGSRTRVDNLPNPDGNIWTNAAGEGVYGTLYYARDVAIAIDEDTEYGDLNQARINCLLARTSGRVVVNGVVTTSSNPQFKYVSVSRLTTWIEWSIVESTRIAIFRANTERWWTLLKDLVSNFLNGIWRSGGLKGTTASDAYYVRLGISDGTMTQANIDAGEQIGEFGIAPEKPTEFLIWRVNQLPGGNVTVNLS